MSIAVRPSLRSSTEIPILKGLTVHHGLGLADNVCQHPSLRDGHGDGQWTDDAHARTALGSAGTERPEARLLRRWRRTVSARRARWREGLDIALGLGGPGWRHG